MFIDPDELEWTEVWAAAGMWRDVFGIESYDLVEASRGVVIELRRERPRCALRPWTPQRRGLARVDIGQIRKQLRLPLKERPRVVADAANVLLSVQEHARRSRSAEAG